MPHQPQMFRRSRLAALIGALALLSACAGPATTPVTSTSSPAAGATTTSATMTVATGETAAAATTASATTTAAPIARGVAPTGTCEELRGALVRSLSLDLTLDEVAVPDPQTGTSRAGCRLRAGGSAAELGTFLDVATRLRTALTDEGWAEDQSLLADGPTGTASGFRKNDVLARTLVEWQPGPDASCPADQPVSACQLTPEQQRLTITLDLTRQ